MNLRRCRVEHKGGGHGQCFRRGLQSSHLLQPALPPSGRCCPSPPLSLTLSPDSKNYISGVIPKEAFQNPEFLYLTTCDALYDMLKANGFATGDKYKKGSPNVKWNRKVSHSCITNAETRRRSEHIFLLDARSVPRPVTFARRSRVERVDHLSNPRRSKHAAPCSHMCMAHLLISPGSEVCVAPPLVHTCVWQTSL